MGNHFFLLGSFLGGVGVVLGAFGAHALEARLTPELLATFETGVRYQIYHALALLIVALVPVRKSGQRMLTISGWLFVTGILFFSGSLYLLTLTGLRSLGLITPLGGMAYIVGWVFLALAAFWGRERNNGK